ncbi:MAG: hypothetical protein VCA35_05005 [Roseibacillus sp.]
MFCRPSLACPKTEQGNESLGGGGDDGRARPESQNPLNGLIVVQGLVEDTVEE